MIFLNHSINMKQDINRLVLEKGEQEICTGNRQGRIQDFAHWGADFQKCIPCAQRQKFWSFN